MAARDPSKPRWPLKDAIRRAEAAAHLVALFRALIEARLSAGLIDLLTADLAILTGTPADRGATRTGQKGATRAERDVATEGSSWVIDVRNMAKRTQGIKKGDLKALGVGERVSPTATDQVRGAIRAILNTTSGNPELARKIGLLTADLTDGERLATTLAGADTTQKGAVALSVDKTFDKNVVQLRVEAAIDEISARGAMASRGDAPLRARFEALVSGGGPAPEDAPGAPPGPSGPPA